MSNHYMIYDPQMFAGHGPDFRGLGFVRKHVERGFDSVNLFRVVDPELLPPARYRRFGLLVRSVCSRAECCLMSGVWFPTDATLASGSMRYRTTMPRPSYCAVSKRSAESLPS